MACNVGRKIERKDSDIKKFADIIGFSNDEIKPYFEAAREEPFSLTNLELVLLKTIEDRNAMLERLEWVYNLHEHAGMTVCPECGGAKKTGGHRDCTLAVMLGKE